MIGAYLDSLVGQPYADDGLFCWVLARRIQRDLFGRELPEVLDVAPDDDAEKRRLFNEHPERANWREVAAPMHGAVVILSRARVAQRADIHAGVYLDFEGGVVAHVDDPHGVVIDRLPVLRSRGWVARWLVPR